MNIKLCTYVYVHMCVHMYMQYLRMYTAYFPVTPNHNGKVAGAGCPHCPHCDSAARCTAHAHNVRRMTFLQFLFCSPASALCCPGRITPLPNLPPAWHGRTSSKNFHLIAAKNGKNKLKEKENNKIKICRWLLFTILLRLCHERRWGRSTATDSDVDIDCDCDCDACYALCGYVMRAPSSPQMAFQLPLHALPCLALNWTGTCTSRSTPCHHSSRPVNTRQSRSVHKEESRLKLNNQNKELKN